MAIRGGFDDLIRYQDGVITRIQALAQGYTAAGIRAQLESGRWQRIRHGVYATFSGPVPRSAQLWAAVLRAGTGALLSHESAAEVQGLLDEAREPLHLTIPTGRRIHQVPGVTHHMSSRTRDAAHPTRTPPQTRIEETVIDLTQSAKSLDQAIGWIVSACGRRLTTPERIASCLRTRRRLKWRHELTRALEDTAEGCHSPLELHYLRRVERAHALPKGIRQRVRQRAGGRWYDDVAYVEYGLLVELDGLAAHRDEARDRDWRRDNAGVVEGLQVLRYGIRQLLGQPCAVAAEVATLLRRNGWRGSTRSCRTADCRISTEHFGRPGHQNAPWS